MIPFGINGALHISSMAEELRLIPESVLGAEGAEMQAKIYT